MFRIHITLAVLQTVRIIPMTRGRHARHGARVVAALGTLLAQRGTCTPRFLGKKTPDSIPLAHVSMQDSMVSLFQTSSRYHNGPGSSNFTQTQAAFLADMAEDVSAGAEVCGTRPMMPQLQFALEVYRELGLVQSPYTRCHVPSWSNMMSYAQLDSSMIYMQMQDLLGSQPVLTQPEDRLNMSHMIICGWAVTALYVVLNFIWRIYRTPRTIKHIVRQKRWSQVTTGFSMSWLDSVIARYGRRDAEVSRAELRAQGPDLEVEPFEAFRTAWKNEVNCKGLEKASLVDVLWHFVGSRTICWMLLLAGASMLLDFVGMALVLDVLVNYLRWASEAHARFPTAALDLLRPTVMVICLCFGVPVVARALSVMLSLNDSYYSNRIISALLASCYEKRQVTQNERRGSEASELTHMLNNDVVKVWNGALRSYVYAVISPVCIVFLDGMLVWRFGWAGILGFATTSWILLLFIPIREASRVWNWKWLQDADCRVRAVKESVFNIRSIKMAAQERSVSARVREMRDRELRSKFRFAMAQASLHVPFGVFPCALVASTLFFHHCITGEVVALDLFTCMQVLSGLVSCIAILAASLQKTMNIPNSVKRIERFLRMPEGSTGEGSGAVQQLARHPDAPHVRLCGSFSYGSDSAAVLHDIDFSASRGEMVAVVGGTSSGKTAFLSAMLGEMSGANEKSHVEAPQKVSYCPQVPWVVNGTLEDNVTLGEMCDTKRFNAAVKGSMLQLDGKRGAEVALRNEVSIEGGGGAGQAYFPYFTMWNILAATCLVLSFLNVRWESTNPVLGILVVLVQGLLHWSVLEIPLQTIATLYTSKPKPHQRADASHLTVVLNYNLLAISEPDVDECLSNMFEAFMGNLQKNVSAVMVSATNDPALQEYELRVRDSYRARIFRELRKEGLCWAGVETGEVDEGRRERLWSLYAHMDTQTFVKTLLDGLCRSFAEEFMVLHRVSRVLRKCGQYQDLMLLSSGEEHAFTYCDAMLYGSAARTPGEPLFMASKDMRNVCGRHFDYTLVLDSDTRVESGSVFSLLEIAAAHPDRAIIQPAIRMSCGPGDSIFMHLEAMRQHINDPMTNTITSILGESGFYGKGMIQNQAYVEKCLGTRERLIECVPIDVLSHDTFEAAVLRPMYTNEIYLLEAPCHNYVTWDIRERRWNRGELLLAMYFFPTLVGIPMRWLQSQFQGRKFNRTQVRTTAKMDHVSAYLAHAALRQIVLKPLLVSYIIMVDFVEMHYEWLPIMLVMFAIIVFPKLAVCNRSNIKGVLLETTASILQFTPESVVGTIRVLRALKAHLTGNARWVPQRAVEDEFKASNPFLFSVRYLWYYLVFATGCGLLVVMLIPEAIFIMSMLGTLFALPLYAGFTALATKESGHSQNANNFPYFALWRLMSLTVLGLSAMNVNWSTTHTALGVLVVVIQGCLHWSVLEIPLQTIAALVAPQDTKLARKDCSNLTVVLNYNLLAISAADVDECMTNMLQAFMGNLHKSVSAVLVSATNEPALQDYELEVRDRCRDIIYKDLYQEGLAFAGMTKGVVDEGRLTRIWSKYKHMSGAEFVDTVLEDVCRAFASEFMVLHRVSRVLRKCGQYQDLMLLSSGDDLAYTYCDASLYGPAARRANEPLFRSSEDALNVKGRRFDYTLVLDSDTRVEPSTVFDMLEIAAAHPDRAIVQPAIKMDVGPGDSIYMHLEAMRQSLNEPMNNTITTILGESGFYGKGLIRNAIYIEKCLGTRDHLIESVPIDVLSHDTFEAAVLRPLYCGEVHLLEAPCGNYVTWDIRERRWNRGEILLAMYFFPVLVGMPMRWLQRCFQGKKYNETQVRTVTELNYVSAYLAHAALRQIILKPLLVSYIILMDFVEMHYEWLPIMMVMFAIIVFPKFASCTTSNFKAVILETMASILQFTPESVVGTIRVLRALKAHLTGNARWVPQRAVEEEFKQSDAFTFSLRYLWYYLAFAMMCGSLVVSLIPEAIFIMTMLGTLFTLPLYAGFTALATPGLDIAAEKKSQVCFPYFTMWNICAILCLVASICNVQWENTNTTLGVVVVMIQGLLHWSVLEIPLQTIATFFTRPAKLNRADRGSLTVALNYNLLAISKADVDECMQNMYEAFVGNLDPHISAVLVSATNDPALREYELQTRDMYRERLYNELVEEGKSWAGFGNVPVDIGRHDRIWSKYSHIDRKEFITNQLNSVCRKVVQEFIVLHRVSRVLRKCGQYQDLMLLSNGEERAFTYCDPALYGKAARTHDEPLFVSSVDAKNVCNRGFDYTLVLDSDTRVEAGTAFELLRLAAAHPDRAILQPAIKMDCGAGDSIFMHVEAMRQSVNEPMNNTIAAILGESGFYGKALIKNELYIKHCLGSRENLIEVVPIEVLSHDTFEAAILRPMYAGDVYLLEAPCNNYVTWDIRERRWNRGELLLAMYFFPVLVGAPMRWLQRLMQGSDFNETHVRTKAELNKVSSYLAHAALRQIVLKPLLVSYIILVDFVQMYFEWLPILLVMFAIVIFPKFATCNLSNFKAVLLETMASILQFTPESVVGTIRVLRALKAHLTGNARWVPQRAVEDEFKASNPFIFSLRYLWYYLVFAVGCGVLIVNLIPEAIFIMTMLGTLFSLPMYAGFTALTANVVRQPLERQITKLGLGQVAALPALPEADAVGKVAAPKSTNVDLGFRGSALSDAEKAKVALARAAYDMTAELVLLDHPLAAIDEAASTSIITNLLKGPLMENKTRIVTMPAQGEELKHFDRVVLLDGGRVVCQGSPDEVLAAREFQAMQMAPTQVSRTTHASSPSPAAPTAVQQEAVPSSAGSALWRALTAGGLGRLCAAIITVGLLRIVTQSQLLILGRWADERQAGSIVDDSRCIKVTVALVSIAAVLQGAQNYFVLAFNAASSKALFEQAYASVLRAPLGSFWDAHPAGRVINRLSGDILTLDLALSTGFAAMASFTFSVVVQQVYCLTIMPAWLMAFSYVALLVFSIMFWGAAVPLQHFSAAAMSGCHDEFAHLGRDATCARAYSFQSRQLSKLISHSGSVVKSSFLGVACSKQWLVMRVTFVLCCQCTACVIHGIMKPDTVGIGTLAIIVASTFNILQEIDSVVDTVANGILTAVSLRRVDEYCHMQREAVASKASANLQIDDGIRIQLSNLRVGHGGGEDCLRGANAEIAPRSKTAIVGAAGSGRSAALLSVMRVLEPRNGQVVLNGTNAKCIDLERLRAAIAYVPQEPSLFRGTIRFNLNPAGDLPDDQLWSALECTRLATTVRALPGGLDHVLHEDGDGLSFGQRQLLCVANALCRKPAALLMDDSLSSLHQNEQALVYNSVMAKLPHTTLVVSTHTLPVAAQFDSVLRLESGKFV